MKGLALQTQNFEALPTHICVDESPRVLSEAYCADVNLAVWTRESAHAGAAHVAPAWYEEVVASQFSARVRIDATCSDVERILSPLPAGDARAIFADDLRFVAEVFADLTSATELGMRLETVDRDLCRFWHTDKVSLRLITTFYGAGTEWLGNHHVWRDRLNEQADDNPFVVLRPGAIIHQLRERDIGVFKGDAWPAPHQAIVHRSPHVAPGSRRLLLTLDPLA